MSAEVENMMYVGRQTPWHGLGVSIEEAPNSEEAIKVAGLDWEVRKERVFSETGIEIPGFFATTRSTDKKVYGMVTDKYQVVQNKDAFAFVDNLLGGDVKYETAGSLFDGRKVWMLARMPEFSINGDKVESYCVISNSHDGKSAVQVAMTNVRVVCNNTLNLALKNAERIWSTRHTGTLEGKLQDAALTLELAEKFNNALAEYGDEMANTSVNSIQLNKFVNEMWTIDEKMSERQKRTQLSLQDEFKGYVQRDDIKKFDGSAWGVLMALTDFTQHRDAKRNTATLADRRMDAVITNTNDVVKGQAVLKKILTA